MKRPGSVILLALCSAFCVAGTSLAESMTLISVKDNTLYDSPTGSLSSGVGVAIFAGRTAQASNYRRRAVIAFDVAGSVPAGSTITSAVLHLTNSGGSAGSPFINLHRLNADWGEGTSDAAAGGGGGGAGAPATPGDATWLHTFFPSDMWATAGGDFEATVSASAAVDLFTPTTDWASTPQMLADVQMWLDSPGTDFGWILVGNEAVPSTATKFETRESLVPKFRPELQLQFIAPSLPVPAMSNWGVVVSLLSIMIVGSIVIHRRLIMARSATI